MNRPTQRYRQLISDYSKGVIDKKAFLDIIQNRYFGGSGLQVQIHDKDGICTTWKDWFEAREKEWWVERINHRTIAPCEAVFDFESPDELRDGLARLKRFHIVPVVISTGSRGHHAHYFDYDLMRRTVEEKRKLYTYIGSDAQKGASRTMVSLELVPHWKTGNVGEVV